MPDTHSIRSPFKLLDSYTREDQAQFFGRDEEVEILYEKVTNSRLVLLYGASGVGKSSLVHCGLGSRFTIADWMDVPVRRQEHMMQAFRRALRGAFFHEENDADEEISIDGMEDPVEMIEALYYKFYIPVYLVFDQLEEIFVSGTRDEQREFFETIGRILSSRLFCKVLFSIREEYLGRIADFESILPGIFDNRMRVEQMSRANLAQVVEGTCAYHQIGLIKEQTTIDHIIGNLQDERGEIDLTHLQVYLDRLYRKAVRDQENAEIVSFDPDLVKETGKLKDVLGLFLEEQIQFIDDELEEDGITLKVLFKLVTDEGTKQMQERKILLSSLSRPPDLLPEYSINSCLERLEASRLIRVDRVQSDENPNEIRHRIELAHDHLALRIYDRVSEEEKTLRRLRTLLDQRYKDYLASDKKDLLSKPSLDRIAPYEEILSLEPEIQDFVDVSKRKLRQRRRRLITAGISFVVLAALGIVTYTQLQVVRNIQQSLDLILRAQEEVKENPTQAMKLAVEATTLDQNTVVMNGVYELYREHAFYDPPIELGFGISSASLRPDVSGYVVTGFDETQPVYRFSSQGDSLGAWNDHMFTLNKAIYSPNGTYVLTVGEDGLAGLWDGRADTLIRMYSDFRDRDEQGFKSVQGAAFAPDESAFAIAAADEVLRWSLTEGRRLDSLVFPDPVLAVDISEENKLAIGTSFGDVFVHEEDSIRLLGGHQDEVSAVAFLPNEGGLITASSDSNLRFWPNLDSVYQEWTGHTNGINCLAISPNGRMILSGSQDRTMRLWNLQGEVLQVFKGHEAEITDVGFAPDGTWIYSASRDGTIRTWPLVSYAPDVILDFATHENPALRFNQVNAIAATSTGDKIFTAAFNEIHQWSGEGVWVKSWPAVHTDRIRSMQVSQDGSHLVSGGNDSLVVLWRIAEGISIDTMKHQGWVNAVAIKDSSWFASGSEDSTAIIWNHEGVILHRLGHRGPVRSVDISGQRPFIVTGGTDSTLRIWGKNGDLFRSVGVNGIVQDLAFSPNGRNMMVITQSEELPISVWTSRGKLEQQWRYDPQEISAADYSANGNLGAFASWNTQVYVTDFSDNPIQLLSHSSPVTDVLFVRQADWIMSLSNQKVFVWKRIRKPLEEFLVSSQSR